MLVSTREKTKPVKLAVLVYVALALSKYCPSKPVPLGPVSGSMTTFALVDAPIL